MKKQERKIEKTVSGFIIYGFAGWEHLTIREVIRKAPTPATVLGSEQSAERLSEGANLHGHILYKKRASEIPDQTKFGPGRNRLSTSDLR